MSQPTKYTPNNDYSDELTTTSVPGNHGAHLDTEFAEIKATTDEIIDNLALIQRDDGELANESVGMDQLKAGVTLGLNSADDWVTATAYETNDGVWSDRKLYRCMVAHTSGTFATDLAAEKWVELVDFDQYLTVAETKATEASNSASSASSSASSAAASFDSFDDRYLGSKTVAPTTDNDGNALLTGASYWHDNEDNTGSLYIWSGSQWVEFGTISCTSDTFSGDGSETDFTLSVTPISEENTFVFVAGVAQAKSTYSLAGNVLSFSEAPPSGTGNIEVSTITPHGIGVPSDGTVSDAKVAASSKLYNRIYDVVSAKDFGATGDGTTDDTAAIQSALDAVEANGGGTVLLPWPDVYYLITDTLDIPNGVTLEGQGYIVPTGSVVGSEFVYDFSTGAATLVYTGTDAAVQSKEGAAASARSENCAVKNLRIDLTGTGAIGVLWVAARSCIIRDVMVGLDGSSQTAIRMKAESTGVPGIRGCFYNDTQNVRIIGNSYANGHTGIYLSGTYSNGQVNDCTFRNIKMASLDLGVDFNVAQGNSFYEISGEYIATNVLKFQANSSYNVVFGAYLEQCGGAGVDFQASSEFNYVVTSVWTPGAGIGGGSNVSMAGNKNQFINQGNYYLDTTHYYRRSGSNTSDLMHWQNSSNVTGVAITAGGALYYTQDAVQSIGAAGATLDASTTQLFRINFNGTPADGSIAISGGTNGQIITLYMNQDATGGRAVTQAKFSNSFWFAGNSYTMSSGANDIDIVRFQRVGGGWFEISRTQDLGT